MCRNLLITLGILCFLSTARAKADDVGYAYCPLGEGYVFLYDSPTSFQVIANLKCGEKLTVVDPRDDNRARVRTADGREGYVQKSSLIAALPGSQRQPAAPAAAPAPPAAPVASIPQPPAEAPAQPKPQSQPRPESQVQAEAEAQPQPQLEAPAQPPVQSKPAAQAPPPAAVAFTPFSTLGYEENVPRLEVFGGYSFMNAGTDGLANRQNVNGFESSVAYNVNRWLAAEGNVAAYYKTITILNVGTFGFHNFLVAGGPRLTVRKVFIHGLIGMDHLANNLYFDGAGPSSGNTVLAAELGGGVQWKVARHIGVRTSADYVLSEFDGWIQSSVRVTAGVVFDLGTQK
jgi:hypothetical protein